MILQIAGTVILTTVIICATWYATTLRKEQTKRRDFMRKEREQRNERLYKDNTFALYKDEEQRRIDAETRIGIVQDQLRRARNENERLKKLIKDLEEAGGLHS